MKKLFALLLALLSLLFAPYSRTIAQAAEAETTPLYAVAAQQGVYLYQSQEDSSGLFILPYTYYVKILSLGDPYCAVEYHTDELPYKAVRGYCKKAELTFVDFTPERPFLKKQISVTYTLPEQSMQPSGNDFLQSVTMNYLFYGEFPVGSARYYYVYGNGAFGYLPAQEKVEYELNVDYLQTTTPPVEDAPPAQGEAEGSTLSPTVIFFLVALGVSVVAVLFLVLRGKKSAPPAQEDFEF